MLKYCLYGSQRGVLLKVTLLYRVLLKTSLNRLQWLTLIRRVSYKLVVDYHLSVRYNGDRLLIKWEVVKLEDKYVVYFGFVDNELVYIGRGKEGRECHLNTGISHVYEANKLHFDGGSVDITKVYVKDYDESVNIERVLTKAFNPSWNKQHTGNDKFVYRKEGNVEVVNTAIIKRLEYFCNKVLEAGNFVDALTQEVSKTKQQNETLLLNNHYKIPAKDKGISSKNYYAILKGAGFNKKECSDVIGVNVRTIQRWDKQLEGS